MDVAFKMQIARVTSYEHLAQQLCDGMHLLTFAALERSLGAERSFRGWNVPCAPPLRAF
jgi:hypothetical protein